MAAAHPLTGKKDMIEAQLAICRNLRKDYKAGRKQMRADIDLLQIFLKAFEGPPRNVNDPAVANRIRMIHEPFKNLAKINRDVIVKKVDDIKWVHEMLLEVAAGKINRVKLGERLKPWKAISRLESEVVVHYNAIAGLLDGPHPFFDEFNDIVKRFADTVKKTQEIAGNLSKTLWGYGWPYNSDVSPVINLDNFIEQREKDAGEILIEMRLSAPVPAPAKPKFAYIDFSPKNERLQRQIDSLKAEQKEWDRLQELQEASPEMNLFFCALIYFDDEPNKKIVFEEYGQDAASRFGAMRLTCELLPQKTKEEILALKLKLSESEKALDRLSDPKNKVINVFEESAKAELERSKILLQISQLIGVDEPLFSEFHQFVIKHNGAVLMAQFLAKRIMERVSKYVEVYQNMNTPIVNLENLIKDLTQRLDRESKTAQHLRQAAELFNG